MTTRRRPASRQSPAEPSQHELPDQAGSAAQQKSAPTATVATSTLTDRALIEKRPSSSWSGVPPEAHNSIAEVHFIYALLPSSLRRSLTRTLYASLTPSRLSLSTSITRLSLPDLFSKSRPSYFRNGYATASTYFLLAILLNHVRRMVFPWMGSWVHHTPLTDLKLALGSPQVFLDETLSSPSWADAALLGGQKVIVDFLGVLAAQMVLLDAETDGGTSTQPAEEDNTARPAANNRAPTATVRKVSSAKSLEIARVALLIYFLASAEYVQARTCHAFSVLIAYGKLLTGTPAHRAVLLKVLARNSYWTASLQFMHVASYISCAVVPLLLAAGLGLARGRPALALAEGLVGYVTYVVTRWSNKYYIVLELWGLVMVLGWACVGGMVVGWEAFTAGSRYREGGKGVREKRQSTKIEWGRIRVLKG